MSEQDTVADGAVLGSSKMFERAVEYAFDHIIITDPDGVVVYANRAAELTTGYSKEEMIGQRPSLWGGLMPKEFYEKMWHTLKTEKKAFRGELENRRKGGEKYDAEVRVSPILNTAGNVAFFVGIERDITGTKAVDRMKSEFISIAAHQLRTPVTMLRWTIESLGGSLKNLSDKQNVDFDQLSASVERLKNLVDNLLNLSRIELRKLEILPERTDIVQFAKKFVQDLMPYAETKKHTLVLHDHSDGLNVLFVDPKILYNIMQNLVSNAIDYSGENTEVTIELNAEEEGLKISVFNRGPAIPKDAQVHIFEKFFRADQAKEMKASGTGLGLNIVRSLVEAFGGKVGFYSEEGLPTEFWFTIPRKAVSEKT